MKHTRHLISLAFAALALVCAADVTRDTEWQDVPPSTRVGTVVDLGQGGGGADTNAVNDLIRSYDTTNLTARIGAKRDYTDLSYGLLYTSADWFISESSMRDKIKACTLDGVIGTPQSNIYGRGIYGWGFPDNPSQPTWLNLFVSIEPDVNSGGFYVKIYENGGVYDSKLYRNGEDPSITTLDEKEVKLWSMFDELATVAASVNYSAVTSIVESASVTNGGAVAYFNSKTGKDILIGGRYDRTIYNGFTVFDSILETKATKLTGRTYDFANGSNFVKRVYEAITNVIQTLGGSVTNAPSF